MTELEPLQQRLTAFAVQAPLWAALAGPSARGSARFLEEVFASGRQEVDEVLAVLDERGIAHGRGRALDFGCGIGRHTRALADHFAACDGVDVSASLIEHARALGEDCGRLRFHAFSGDLRLFGNASFDFILAVSGLRDVGPAMIPSYVGEFVRVLRPGGVAFINLPDRFVSPEKLPDEGWQATLTAPGAMSPLTPGEVFPLTVHIHNDSPIPWLSSAQLRVAQRWRGSDGGVVAIGRTGAVIPETVKPGGDYALQLWLVAPPEPGGYELELDLVQEEFGWFADRGSRAMKLAVAVVADGATTKSAALAGERLVAHTEHPGPVLANEAHVMPCQAVIATVEDAGGVVLEMLAKDRSGPSMRSFDYVLARALSPTRSPGAEPDHQAATDARIRRALRYTAGSAALSAQMRSGDLQRSQRRRDALHLVEQRADLVGFGLTSGLKGLARASTLVREGLRRALFEVLFRQSEFNQASGDLIRGHEEQLKVLGATVRAQLDIEARADERLAALEHRLAQLEVDSRPLARRAEGEAARPAATDRHAPD